MKRIVFGVAGLMIVSLTTLAVAEEPNAEKTLKSFGEFVVGGVWKYKSQDGKERTTEHQWFGQKKFLRVSRSRDGKADDWVQIIGVDPKTNMVTLWEFSGKGYRAARMTQTKAGVWNVETEFKNEQGSKITWKGRFVSKGPDEMHIETIKHVEDGVEKPSPAIYVLQRS